MLMLSLLNLCASEADLRTALRKAVTHVALSLGIPAMWYLFTIEELFGLLIM